MFAVKCITILPSVTTSDPIKTSGLLTVETINEISSIGKEDTEACIPTEQL